MTYRTATALEIADCIDRQVVEPCKLADSPEYRRNPSKLRDLIRGIEACARSNVKWLRSQHRVSPPAE